ncbi:MAG: radical SAM protein [Blastocatellia bacterium]|nr:radical SAM protein [Blastocatellia bacterium]
MNAEGNAVIGNQLSLILLPTNKCNVACEYCFEDKTDDFMSHEKLAVVIDKLLDHMERKAISLMTIYWQGGEIMLLPPEWFERAQDLITEAAGARGKQVEHSLQSNMIGYNRKWNKIIAEMFAGSVGTSMDYPNLYRRARNRPPDHYTEIWTRNVREAREGGIQVGVISIPNKGTLEAGAERFYSYFVDELGIKDFQVNTSFSGGEPNDAKKESILDLEGLSRFFVELARVWVERGYEKGIKLGPLDQLMSHFRGEGASLPCIWRQNCTDEFVSIDARGYVAQCDCWVTSYPEYWFGNIFEDISFTELLQKSRARQRFQARPEVLMQHESCAGCDYLSICHGGCPVRTYSITGDFYLKDPYCPVYKAIFSTMEELAARMASARRRLPVLRVRPAD